MGGKKKLFFGIAVNDLNERIIVDGKNIKSYDCWRHMLRRCYDQKHQSTRPTYIGCSVSNEWLCFSNFKEFYDKNYKDGYQLDKDILIQNNKIYSESTSVFVPRYLNMMLTDRRNERGNYPLGVSKLTDSDRKKPYTASCSDGFGKILINCFSTIEEAREFYIRTKRHVVLQQIERAKSEGFNDERVFQALLEREF